MLFDQNGNIQIDCGIKYPNTDYQKLKDEALKCNQCPLRSGAKQVVMGKGNLNKKIMFIGEGPGADEDRLGEPFVGKAGQLLNRILAAAKINREDVYITNMVKCRPPHNRNPLSSEIKKCTPILLAEIKIINPKVIVPLGSIALKHLLDENASITKMRGKWTQRGKYFLLPTFHPSYLLRNPAMKKAAWHDFQLIKKSIERIEELLLNDQV